MHLLTPSAAPDTGSLALDAYELYRPRQPAWLRLNMVVSLDGAVVDQRGRSGGLGGPGDAALFSALRALADAILVGAGTARAEGYGPHRPKAELRERRIAEGRSASAPLVVVTRSGDLDYGGALFTEAVEPTVVLTCAAASHERRAAAAAAGRLLVAGDADVDLVEGLRMLREDLGLRSLLCEGGPHLNAALINGDLVDELCTTISPQLAMWPSLRYLEGGAGPRQLQLVGVAEHDGELFVRHVLERSQRGTG